jgi:hypothetical protein
MFSLTTKVFGTDSSEIPTELDSEGQSFLFYLSKKNSVKITKWDIQYGESQNQNWLIKVEFGTKGL